VTVRGAIIAFAVLLAAPATAQTVSEEPDSVSITIYRDGPAGAVTNLNPLRGLAQVTETRTVDVPAGRGRISFRGVADTIVPQTAAIEGLPGAVVERNQDYDLLSPGALVRESVGMPVRLVETDRKTGRVTETAAVIRSSAGGGVVLQTDEGLRALSCSGQPERLVFDKAPPGLADKPTLSVLTDAPAAGRYKVRLSYLATGFAWSADYVARVRPDGRALDLAAWLTLTNGTSANFGRAPTEVVAGELSRNDDTRPTIAAPEPLLTRCWSPAFAPPPLAAPAERGFLIEEVVLTARRVQEPAPPAALARQSDLGDYKLYALPEPTTVAAHQTKQVRFLDQKGVRFERVYAYRLRAARGKIAEADMPQAATIIVRVDNTRRNGLGKPLPSGMFAVTEADPSGRPILSGEHRAERDTPVGLTLDLELGRAMDVTVAPQVVSHTAQDDGGRYEVAVDLMNGKSRPVIVEYRHAPDEKGFEVVRESQRHGTKAGDPMWTLTLAAGERRELRYVVAYKDD